MITRREKQLAILEGAGLECERAAHDIIGVYNQIITQTKYKQEQKTFKQVADLLHRISHNLFDQSHQDYVQSLNAIEYVSQRTHRDEFIKYAEFEVKKMIDMIDCGFLSYDLIESAAIDAIKGKYH